MKKSKKLIISIFIIFSLFIGVNFKVYSSTGFIIKNMSTYEDTEPKAFNQSLKSSENTQNKTMEEWEQYAQDLLLSIYDETWGYSEWWNYMVMIGYEMGQITDENINDEEIQYNIHIATIIRWGKHNGTLTDDEITYLSNQMMFNTIYFNRFWFPDEDDFLEDIDVLVDHGITYAQWLTVDGPEKVVQYFLQSKSQYSGGHWETLDFTNPLVPIGHGLWPLVGESGPTGFIENNVEFRFGCVVWFLLALTTYYDPNTIFMDIVDDDTEPPQVFAVLYNLNLGPIHPSARVIKNGMLVDISAISYNESASWAILIFVADRHEIFWLGWDEDDLERPKYLWYNPMIVPLQMVYDLHNSKLIRFFAYFIDNDRDRVNDEQGGYFKFVLCRYKNLNLPNSVNFQKVEGFDPHEGIFLSYSDYANNNFPSTCIYPYKENNLKNEVSVKINFENPEAYPIRLKIGGLLPYMRNIEYSLLPNINQLYMYAPSSLDNYIYDGDRLFVENLDDIFSNDLYVDSYDKAFHFWVDLLPGELKTIELFSISPDDIRLLDPERFKKPDLAEGIWSALGIGSDLIGGVIGSKVGSYMTHASKWDDLMNLDQNTLEVYSLAEDLYEIYEDWSSTEYSQRVCYGEMLGSILCSYITILEAYSADDFWDEQLKDQLEDQYDVEIWWWHLDDLAGKFHYKKGDPHNKWLNPVAMLNTSGPHWIVDPDDPLLYYAGIGFIPDEHQVNALEEFLALEAGMDALSIGTTLISFIPVFWYVGIIGDIISLIFDLCKDTTLLDIANGRDPPDPAYYEIPDEELISFPYESYPEFYNELQAENPIALKGKAVIDEILKIEQGYANILTATNRYSTAFDQSEFSACLFQIQNMKTFQESILDSSSQLNDIYISFVREIEAKTGDELLTFTEEEMQVIASTDFEVDPRFHEVIENYETIRNVDTNLIEKLETEKNAFDSLEVNDMAQLNEIADLYGNSLGFMEQLPRSLMEENARTNQFISIEKLGIDPVLDPEIEMILDQLRYKLESVSRMILDEEYQDSISLLDEIMSESLEKYHQTLVQDFYSIYLIAEGYKLFTMQMNQIDVKILDQSEKSVRNGCEIGFCLSIENIVGQGIINKFGIIEPTINIGGLPEGMSYKIFHLGNELDKNDQGIYHLPIASNEIKNIKVQFYIVENSNLESETVDLSVEIEYDNPEKKMYFEVDLRLNVVDDDETAPMLSLSYEGGGTDGDIGTLDIEVDDPDLGSAATAELRIMDEFGNVVYSVDYSEGIYTLDLSILDIGQYLVVLDGENNDEDILGDEEFASEDITLNIVDDDETAPIIENLIIENQLEEVLISFDILEDTGLGEIFVSIDGIEVIHEYPSISERFFEFIIINNWITELGVHDVYIVVWDADYDRPSDSLGTDIWGSFETLTSELKLSMFLDIDQLIEFLEETSEDSWIKKKVKDAMLNKLTTLKDLASENKNLDAYDKLLHDIKPKLTGLKCDEEGVIWDGGVFYNPWIIDVELQGVLCIFCDEVLTKLSILIESTFSSESQEITNDAISNWPMLDFKGLLLYAFLVFLGIIGYSSTALIFRRKLK